MRLRCLGIAALLLSASVAWGDGCYFPERAVRKIPEISAQRAVLSWKDGIETLVIASALDSESQELGWIVPLPSVPRKIEKESPGALKTLDFCIQPWITHDLSLLVGAIFVLACIGNWVVATWVFKPERLGCVLTVLVTLGTLFSLMLPTVGMVRMVTTTGNVQVERTVAVGAYLVSILRAAQRDDLNAWLVENGYAALPSEADQAVADYISRGWVFAAIKLTRTESGANVPHPIRIEFATKEAVYPMKLTAIAGGAPRIELFVIANRRLSCDLLAEEFCDAFAKKEDAAPVETGSDETYYETHVLFRSLHNGCLVGHPSLCELMWDGCILTKLAGAVSADDMTEDLTFVPKPFLAYRQHFFTMTGAWEASLIFLVLATAISAAIAMMRYSARVTASQEAWRYFRRELLLGIALSGIGAAILLAVLPKIASAEVHLSRSPDPPSLLGQTAVWTLRSLLAKAPQVLERSESEIAAFLLKDPGDGAARTNTMTGADLQVEDSPGNFTIKKESDRVLIRVYDSTGMVFLSVHPIQANGNRNQPNDRLLPDRRQRLAPQSR